MLANRQMYKTANFQCLTYFGFVSFVQVHLEIWKFCNRISIQHKQQIILYLTRPSHSTCQYLPHTFYRIKKHQSERKLQPIKHLILKQHAPLLGHLKAEPHPVVARARAQHSNHNNHYCVHTMFSLTFLLLCFSPFICTWALLFYQIWSVTNIHTTNRKPHIIMQILVQQEPALRPGNFSLHSLHLNFYTSRSLKSTKPT